MAESGCLSRDPIILELAMMMANWVPHCWLASRSLGSGMGASGPVRWGWEELPGPGHPGWHQPGPSCALPLTHCAPTHGPS